MRAWEARAYRWVAYRADSNLGGEGGGGGGREAGDWNQDASAMLAQATLQELFKRLMQQEPVTWCSKALWGARLHCKGNMTHDDQPR